MWLTGSRWSLRGKVFNMFVEMRHGSNKAGWKADVAIKKKLELAVLRAIWRWRTSAEPSFNSLLAQYSSSTPHSTVDFLRFDCGMSALSCC
jgi:hypothetical protein